MKDAKSVLDGVRAKIPSEAKLLVAWQRPDGGVLVLSQANLSQEDLSKFVASLQQATLAPGVGQAKRVLT